MENYNRFSNVATSRWNATIS